MTVDEPVHFVEYDAYWPTAFAVERQRLCEALAVPESHIEHIGSTAVPGLGGKAIIDLMLGAATYPPSAVTTLHIERLGYQNLGEAGVPERLYFRRRVGGDFNLHVVRLGGNHWIANLALRDYLRAHSPARTRYANAKRHALVSGHNTLLSYSEAKATVVNDILVQALEWRREGLTSAEADPA